MTKHYENFVTTDYQYGFKKQHSTVQCTFVVNEIIQYYLNNDTNVYAVLLDASKAFDRVNYVKLFRLLLKKNLCPIVIRFLAKLYTSQSIRTIWGSFISEQVSVSNGVKQGGVLSPILFIIYMDELLHNLSTSGVGCYIGNTFCGSFGFADDIILLSPTLMSIKKMLCICETFANEYDVLFNSEKSKLLMYSSKSKRAADNIKINFMAGTIVQSKLEKHLGNIIGPCCNEKMIDDAVSDFYVRVNMTLSHFANIAPHVRYKLFKTYCMSLYGSQLWDLQNKYTNKLYVSWRKAVRRVLAVPNTTHCKLLHYIAEDKDINVQIYERFIKFMQNASKCDNKLTNLCVKLASTGSRSHVSNNISVVCNFYNISRSQLCSDVSHKQYICPDDAANIINAAIVRELLYQKHITQVSVDPFLLSQEEMDFIIVHLCTK